METNSVVRDHSEITGVSRSGRVCKKSSKLLDFQSVNDNNESKTKRSSNKKPISNQSSSTEECPANIRKSSNTSNHKITAYMLWAKDYRSKLQMTNPRIKSSLFANLLAGLWSELPNSEKYTWRRRAIRLASQENSEQSATIKKTPFYFEHGQFEKLSLDVAAHLKLLGENLKLIGDRLIDHEGQVNVSGSLSVLLDSMLCSIGPLMILIKAIPNVRNDSELNNSLSTTIENISYIMPGL